MSHIVDWLRDRSSACPYKALSVCGSRQVSYEQAAQRVAALATALKAYGVRLGDRIVLLANNSDYLCEALLAVAAAGAIATPLNTRWTAQEVAAATQLSSPILVICEAAFYQLLERFLSAGQEAAASILLLGQRSKVAQLRPCTEELISAHRGAVLAPQQPKSGVAMIMFTSGTTGAAKGVCITHSALVFQAKAKVETLGYNGGDIYLHTSPLCHVGGLVSWLAMLQVGARHVFMPKYSRTALLRLVSQHQVTAFIAVPAMIVDLVGTQEGPQVQLPSVKRLLLGGGELHSSMHARLRKLLPTAQVWVAYGMTECASSITAGALLQVPSGPGDSLAEGSYVGRPPPGIEINTRPALQNSENRASGTSSADASQPQAAAGWAEEVVTRGPHVTPGYWNDPRATDAAFSADGWFRTGDLGRVDASGNLWLMGRLKDVIRSGSENVAAGEVEKVLMRHRAVIAAAVVGLPHPRLEEQVAALVQVKPQGPQEDVSDEAGGTSAEQLAQFCRAEGLAGFKVPRVIYLQQDPLPCNSSGKVLKHLVRQRLLELQGAPGTQHSRL